MAEANGRRRRVAVHPRRRPAASVSAPLLVSRARNAHNHHNSASTASHRLRVPQRPADQLATRYVCPSPPSSVALQLLCRCFSVAFPLPFRCSPEVRRSVAYTAYTWMKRGCDTTVTCHGQDHCRAGAAVRAGCAAGCSTMGSKCGACAARLGAAVPAGRQISLGGLYSIA
jgi:hypothetical protein